MNLHELQPAAGSKHARKRIGRGPGSGTGKTAGRGHKGQRSRSGYSRRLGFEGGQMPLVRRVPKRGFHNLFRQSYVVVNLGQLAEMSGEVGPAELAARGLVRETDRIKILGDGEITAALTVRAHKFSRAAREKITAAGGRCEDI